MRTDLGLRLVDIAKFHIGINETGNNQGVMVERFQKCVDGIAAGEPWCMAFVQYCLNMVLEAHGGSTKMVTSEHCLTVWNKTPPFMRREIPTVGCVAIWQHGDSTAGHTGIVVDVMPSLAFLTVEGNTGNAEGIVREGDGVYMKLRSKDTQSKMKLLGFIDPFHV